MTIVITARFIVRGRVQGVWFRASARDRAHALGIDGWARNLDDGGVEVQAKGTTEQLAEFERWLWIGPPRAQVESVTRSEGGEVAGSGFDVR